MLWLLIFIFCLLVIGALIVEVLVKKKFNLPRKFKFQKRSKNQIYIEVLIGLVFMIGMITANISRYVNGDYHPLNPIPLYLWYALFSFILFGFRGYMSRKFATDSKEYVIHFTHAIATPFIIIIGYYAAKILLV